MDYFKKNILTLVLMALSYTNPLYANDLSDFEREYSKPLEKEALKDNKKEDAYLTAPVQFYRDKMIILPKGDNNVKKTLVNYLMQDKFSDQFNFSQTDTNNPNDYKLLVDYAVGCGFHKPVANCRIGFLWTLIRYDNAPVTSWRADYPLVITQEQVENRFVGTNIPKNIVEQASHDLLKSMSDIYVSQIALQKPIIFSGDFLKFCGNFNLNKFLSNYNLRLSEDKNTKNKWRTFFSVKLLPNNRQHIEILHGLENNLGKKATLSQELLLQQGQSFACENSLKVVMPKIAPFFK